MSKHWRYALIGALTVTSVISQADNSVHSLSDIAGTAALAMQSRAAEQGYQHIDVQVRPLDGRLGLANCTQALTTLPANTARALRRCECGGTLLGRRVVDLIRTR